MAQLDKIDEPVDNDLSVSNVSEVNASVVQIDVGNLTAFDPRPIEAKDLNSKDPNGLADPFVTLYIASSPSTRYTSSVKSATLCPVYEEHFSL